MIKLTKWVCLVVVLVVLITGLWYSWMLHFWTVPGRVLRLQSSTIGGYEFELWQRKNEGWLEGFTTGLFVRTPSNQLWEAFSVGHGDGYLPAMQLQPTASGIDVFKERKLLGSFDLTKKTFIRLGQKEPIREGTTDSPQNWWISP